MANDHDLQRRVERLETVARAAICTAAGLPLALGTLVPYLSYSDDGEDRTASLLTIGFDMLTSSESGAGAFAAGYLGLMVVAAVALGVLGQIAVGTTPPPRWGVSTTLTLLVVGTAVALLLGLVAEGNQDGSGGGDLHASVLLFVAGVAAFVGATRATVTALGR